MLSASHGSSILSQYTARKNSSESPYVPIATAWKWIAKLVAQVVGHPETSKGGTIRTRFSKGKTDTRFKI